MIPDSIKRDHLLQAFKYIDQHGVPPNRLSRKFYVVFNGKRYPPKYAVSVAFKILTGEELPPSQFGGGVETNSFLRSLGFQIVGTDADKQVGDASCFVGAVVFIQKKKKAKTNEAREAALRSIVEKFVKEAPGEGVIVFPGGWFEEKGKAGDSIPTRTESIRKILRGVEQKIVVCYGIDGNQEGGHFRDQLGIAVSQDGLLAVARKFHPTKEEENAICTAPDIAEKEEGHSRWFDAFGKRFILAVCYDVFGIVHQKLPNPPKGCERKVDVVCALIHIFSKPGSSGSGDVYFARMGLGVASMRWKVPVFGAVVYEERKCEEGIRRWPSGVRFKVKKKPVRELAYGDFRMEPYRKVEVEVPEGLALVNIFRV